MCGAGEERGDGMGLPTPSLMACRAFRELLEKVVPPPPAQPGWLELIGEVMPEKEQQTQQMSDR